MTPDPIASPVVVQLVAAAPSAAWAQWVPALVAIATAAVALYGVNANNRNAWKIAQQQYRATIVAASRQKWIDAVRDASVGLLHSFERLTTAEASPWPHYHQIEESARRLSLLLNPKEPDSEIVADGIRGALDEVIRGRASAESVGSALAILDTLVVPAVQRQMGEAWGKIKRGE